MWVFGYVQPCCNDSRMGSCIRLLRQGSTTAKRWLAPSCLILVFAMVPASTQAAAPGYKRSAVVSKYSDSVGLFFCGARSPAHAQNGVVHCFEWPLPAAYNNIRATALVTLSAVCTMQLRAVCSARQDLGLGTHRQARGTIHLQAAEVACQTGCDQNDADNSFATSSSTLRTTITTCHAA